MKLSSMISLSALCFGLLSTTYADTGCKQEFGKLYCGATTLSSLLFLGDVTLDGTTVTGPTRVIGDIKIMKSHLNDAVILGDFHSSDSSFSGKINITGDTHLTNTTFKDTAKITGNLEAHQSEFDSDTTIVGFPNLFDTTFKSPVSLASKEVYFYGVNAVGVHFMPSKTIQNIYLKNNTTINGDLSFESNTGIVYLYAGSKINGKVLGGKTINN